MFTVIFTGGKMKTTCPECGSKNIKINMEEILCNKCGLVIQEKEYFSGQRVLV